MTKSEIKDKIKYQKFLLSELNRKYIAAKMRSLYRHQLKEKKILEEITRLDYSFFLPEILKKISV